MPSSGAWTRLTTLGNGQHIRSLHKAVDALHKGIDGMDNTRLVRPENSGVNNSWRVCTSGSGGNFTTEDDAKTAVRLCREAFLAGRRDKGQEISKALRG